MNSNHIAVAAIIAIVIGVGLAYPSFRKPTKAENDFNLCFTTQRRIMHAKSDAIRRHALADGAAMPDDFASQFLSNSLPRCPSGPEYTVGGAGEETQCHIHGSPSKWKFPDKKGD